MVNTVWVNANNGRYLHFLTDQMTKLKNFTKEENHDFSAFQFSLEQTLTNLIVSLMISQKLHIKVAQTS